MEHEMIQAPRGAIWAANVFACALDKIETGIEFIHDQFQERHGLDNAKTPEDVRIYARSIQTTQPSFASELIAAANKAEE